jgi:hypothetical protein
MITVRMRRVKLAPAYQTAKNESSGSERGTGKHGTAGKVCPSSDGHDRREDG